MKIFKLLCILFFCISTLACNKLHFDRPSVNLVPYPNKLQEIEGFFVVNENSKIIANCDSAQSVASLFSDIIFERTDTELSSTVNEDSVVGGVRFVLDESLNLDEESYKLNISTNGILLSASTSKGLFYGVMTLQQLISVQHKNHIVFPALDIVDSPRFGWRGLHLDVSRHFFSVDFVKKYIDYLAFHKLNVLHWHLVDGIGWRIEIKSHPKLTSIGAWRKVKEGKRPWHSFEVWREGDSEPKYGGFYTQKQIKEVVAYAEKRFITVVPEIEMPGHSKVVFQCYPELLCVKKNGKKAFGSDVYCASNSSSYKLLEDVLDEIVELFPSKYIHIGGDEVNKRTWKKCIHCTQMMKENGFSAKQLQSHFVNHFEKYLSAKGRKLIGWHEILEGDLSKSATIMYWGSDKSLRRYLKKGHPTVVTTGNILYFDHYQSLSKHEPKAFGGFSSLTRVYNYDPVPKNLNADLQSNVMGVQANLWSEYLTTDELAHHRTFPRLAALSEIAWTDLKNKNINRFRKSMPAIMQQYDSLGIAYSKSAYRPSFALSLDSLTRNINIAISTELEAKIYYTTDGSVPSVDNGILYDTIAVIDKKCVIKAISVLKGIAITEVESFDVEFNKAHFAKVKLLSKPSRQYRANGAASLVDLDYGANNWGNGKWVGTLSKDFLAIIDLSKVDSIQSVSINTIQETGAGVHFPESLQVWVSKDGVNYTNIGVLENHLKKKIVFNQDVSVKRFTHSFDKIEARYIKVKSKYRRVPKRGSFLFIDEVTVN